MAAPALERGRLTVSPEVFADRRRQDARGQDVQQECVVARRRCARTCAFGVKVRSARPTAAERKRIRRGSAASFEKDEISFATSSRVEWRPCARIHHLRPRRNAQTFASRVEWGRPDRQMNGEDTRRSRPRVQEHRMRRGYTAERLDSPYAAAGTPVISRRSPGEVGDGRDSDDGVVGL